MSTASGKLAPKPAGMKSAPAVAIITAKNELLARIDKWAASGSELQAETHVLACSVLAHTAKHGNINILTGFLEKTPAMVRLNALSAWFEAFGQLTYGPLKDGDDPMWRIDRTKKAKLGDAMVKPFWKFKAHEGMPYQPLDMAKWCEQTIKRLEKDAKEAKVNHDHLIMFLKTYNPQSELAGQGLQTGDGIAAHGSKGAQVADVVAH